MSNRQEYFRFLVALLTDFHAPQTLPNAGSKQWEQLIATASDHAILPLASSRLTHGLANANLPADVADFLAAYLELNAARNRRLLVELEAHARSLNALGIEPVALKGLAYLLEGVYARPEERLLLDMDLLVAPERLDDAYEVFLRAGFAPAASDAKSLTLLHRPALTREEWSTVELHHRLIESASGLLPADEVIRRSTPFLLGNAVVRLPSPVDQAIHLIAHSQISHGYDQRIWPPLRAQYDLVCLAQHFGNALDWREVRARFADHRLTGVLDLHLLQVERTLGWKADYHSKPNWMLRTRWWRRQLLWRAPFLRFLDPLYLYRAWLQPRLRTALRLWKVPGGRRYLIDTLFQRSFYRRVFAALRPF